MKLFFSTLTLLTIGIAALTQPKNGITISGSVSDSITQKTIGLVTVGLYHAADTKVPIRNLVASENGLFEFKNIKPGRYILFFTHTAYEEKNITFYVDSTMPVLKLGNQQLFPMGKILHSVTVVGERKKPLVEQQEDRTIYNAEADPSNAGLTALDLLRKTPLITVDGEDNIQLNGQTNFRVLLNGKETSLFTRDPKTVLKGFPANLVKRVEVITTPSAKYDGEGVGGLINIITAKKILGYNGYAGLNLNVLNMNGYSGFNAKYGNWGFSGYFGFNGNNNPLANTFSEIKSLNPIAYRSRIALGNQESKFKNVWGNLEISFEPDSLNTFSLYGDLVSGSNRNLRNTTFSLVLPTIIDTVKSSFNTINDGTFPNSNIGLDYVRKFKNNKARELTLRFLHAFDKSDNLDLSQQFFASTQKYILNDNKSRNTQLTFQADMIEPLKKGRRIEFGFKGILRNASSDYKNLFKTDPALPYTLLSDNSNFFDYKQYVYSAYSTYRFTWQKISFRLGMRWEKTMVDGNFRSSNTSVTQNYNTFMPNLYLSKRINNIHTLSLSYSKRLARPFIYNLNPFISNIDTLNLSFGNPDLGPQISHNVELGYSVFKGTTSINLRLSEIFSNNDILRYSIFDDATGIRKTTSGNIGATATTSLNGSVFSKLTAKWTININLGLKYIFLRNKFNATQRNSGFGGNAFVYTGYEIVKKLFVFTNASFWQNPVTLQGRNRATIWYGSGISYKFLKDKLSVSLLANNFLAKTRTWYSIAEDENFTSYTEIQNIVRALGLSLNWSFGKLSENVSKKKGISNDDLKAKD